MLQRETERVTKNRLVQETPIAGFVFRGKNEKVEGSYFFEKLKNAIIIQISSPLKQ